MNYFIACGGTGAHVMRAVVRMHILGHPFGLFEDTEFPHLILVDKDDGTGVDENNKTPWQDVKNFIDEHLGQFYNKDYGFDEREKEKRCEVMNPLPKGKDDNWSKDPYNTLGYTFQDSKFLELITSENQRKIDYSMGMMASPAVGALLFKLKEFDISQGKELNRDTIYDDLKEKSTRNRVLVCGSSVGGTGSSIAPTLARSLVKHEAEVMAVMIHRWFEFKIEREGDEEKNEKAKKRNNTMKENAAGGLASYGEGMAEEVATVLIGVPEKGLVKRTYTSDNQQSCKDSYAHVVAAIACMKHFFEKDKYEKGLYGVSANKNDRLTRGIIVWKKKNGDNITLGHLADRARVLVITLKKFSEILKGAKEDSRSERFLNFLSFAGQDFSASPIFNKLYEKHQGDKNRTDWGKDLAKQLDSILKIYESHINWLEEFGNGSLQEETKIEGVIKDITNMKCMEILEGLDESKIINTGKKGSTTPLQVALALFYRTAEFIEKDLFNEQGGDLDKEQRTGGYWPEGNEKEEGSLQPSWKDPGELGKVGDKQKVLGNCYKIEDVSPNSWPSPLASVEEFAFRIEKKNPLAIRKLEILLVGLSDGILKLKPIKRPSEEDTLLLSLEKVIDKECNNLAKYRVIHNRDETTYGFTSPKTLLCPVPDRSDEDWNNLFSELTGGHSYKIKDWKKSNDWGQTGRLELERVAGWLKRVRPYFGEKRYSWANTLKSEWDEKLNNAQDRPFGISEWLPLYEAEKGEGVPLPLKKASDSSSLPEAYKEKKEYKNIENIAGPTKYKDETFTLISDFRIPDEGNPIGIIWKEHLDALQIEEEIFTWGEGEKDEIWVIEKYGEQPKYIKNIRVIEKDTIRIQRTCIPLKQNPVPNSNSNVRTKYPDLPLLPDYIELVKTEKDSEDRSVNHNWKGVPKAIVKKDGQEVVWSLHLLGRSNPVQIQIPIHKEKAKAHWMVWPNFKSHGWRSYYIYEDSSREGLEARVVYLDLDGEKFFVSKKNPSDMGAARAVKYDNDRHSGGPPVAICAYDEELKDVGIYVIRLDERKRNGTWKLAIDFGTSHTVAAFKVGDKTEVVKLRPELISDSRGPTYHVSENWPQKDDHKSEFEVWRPTYKERENSADENENILQSLLSSDMWFWEGEKGIGKDDYRAYWEPMRHYAIPVTDLRRPDHKTHVVSGFKRTVNEGVFAGEESFLQRKYLEMAIEIFIAGIVVEKEILPEKIQFMFTYPRRGDINGLTDRYKASIKDVLSNSSRDLGYTKEDSGKFYSESYAARGTIGKGQSREVKLVADLGGGTLDISISTSDETNPEENRFNQVEDSAELGGDILLKILANDAEKYLPHGDKQGWYLKNPDVCFKQLRAWMRTEGSSRLFSEQHHDWKPIDDRLGLSGLPGSNDPLHARKLIAHYFGLIVDFLARSLVAYVEKYVWDKLYPHELEIELYIKIQGNGWRLWYEKKSYQEIEEIMRKRIQTRAAELWKEFRENDKEKNWPSSKHDDLGPKIAPICNAINISDKTEKDSETSYKFPLCKVYVEDKDPALCREEEWYESLPFENVQHSTIVKVKNFEPPLHISDRHGITSIDDPSMREINNKIKRENKRGGMDTFDAFIAAVIWENVLKSKEFRGS